jgi:hypothetical protein
LPDGIDLSPIRRGLTSKRTNEDTTHVAG